MADRPLPYQRTDEKASNLRRTGVSRLLVPLSGNGAVLRPFSIATWKPIPWPRRVAAHSGPLAGLDTRDRRVAILGNLAVDAGGHRDRAALGHADGKGSQHSRRAPAPPRGLVETGLSRAPTRLWST
jgi:hypothetical protein